MHGLMMDRPLLISEVIEHGATVFGDTEIVTRTTEGPIHRYTYADAHRRSKQLANALSSLGITLGDRVGTVAWNNHRHFELYYGVSGMGAVCHTINPRLHPSQLVYIVNHAADKLLFVDLTFLPLIEAVAAHLKTVSHVVAMTDRANMPETTIDDILCYEDLIASHSDQLAWPVFDERTASSLCYTSGTTGNPKGVLYTHRSTILHSLAVALPGAIGLGEGDAFLPVVPMFHVNAWGSPYATPITGTKLVLPGPGLDGASLTELMNAEGVTCTAGVPTVWLGLLNHWREHQVTVPSLKRVVVGGAAPPLAMFRAFQEEFGIELRQGWGMTETSPVGTIGSLKPAMQHLTAEQRYAMQCKQGRPVFGIQLKIVDDQDKPLPHDGQAFGELKIRGPWVCSGYYGEEDSPAHAEAGWFATGDVATIDANGYMHITDRLKDLIKSGGEWISSIDLENLATSHPEILQAAVIGVPDEKWGERPLLIAVPKAGMSPTQESLLAFLRGKVADWWIPDEVVFESELPLGATGKVQKTKLREQFRSHRVR